MKVFQTPELLIIKENPGCLWLFGSFFAAFGILFIYGAFNGFYIFGTDAPWAVSLTFLFGALGLVIGFWTIYKTPISQLYIDKTSNEVILGRWGIFGKRTFVYQFEEIEKFLLIQRIKGHGGLVYDFGLRLQNGENIAVTSLGSHAEDYESKYIYPINVFIGKEFPACQLNFESESENKDEMS
jgi:hypothetical protein